MCEIGTVGVNAEKTDEELAQKIKYATRISNICILELRKRGWQVIPKYQSGDVYDFSISKRVEL